MAFPVEVREIPADQQNAAEPFPAYGDFTYQGAYVYGIDLDNGFQLRGRITHLTPEQMRKSGYSADYNKSVRRILYAGNTLYTLSESMLKANDMNSLEERGVLLYPALPDSGYPAYPQVTQIP